MGGEIGVTSSSGTGSTFAFDLEVEVIAWEVEAAAESPAAPETTGGPLKILLVEDHPVNRMILEAWMRSMGHDCAMAESGRIACDMAETTPFDLIVMDVNMPVMDGLSATRAIRRSQGPNLAVPIAVLSASARPEDHALGFAAGADAYLDKPVDFATVALVLSAAPTGRSAVQALHLRRATA